MSVLHHDSNSTTPSYNGIYGIPSSRHSSFSPGDSFWIPRSSDHPSSFLNSYSFSPSDEPQRISPRGNLNFTATETFGPYSQPSFSRASFIPLRHSPNPGLPSSGLVSNSLVPVPNTTISTTNQPIPALNTTSTISPIHNPTNTPHPSLRDLTSVKEYIPPSITPILTKRQSTEDEVKKDTDLCMEEAGENIGNGNPNGGQRRGGRRKNGRVTDSSTQLLAIDPEKALTDPRTTLMIRNIPNRYVNNE